MDGYQHLKIIHIFLSDNNYGLLDFNQGVLNVPSLIGDIMLALVASEFRVLNAVVTSISGCFIRFGTLCGAVTSCVSHSVTVVRVVRRLSQIIISLTFCRARLQREITLPH